MFAPVRRTTSLEDAVLRLGVHRVRSLVLTSQIVAAPDPAEPGERDRLQLLNDHALETARLARRLAPPAGGDDAFCAGLLHACGRLALDPGRSDGSGETAAQAGAYLLALWGLPREVVEAVARHSGPLRAGVDPGLDLVSVVRLAHLLVESEGLGACGQPCPPGPDPAWLQAAGVLREVAAWRAEQREKAS